MVGAANVRPSSVVMNFSISGSKNVHVINCDSTLKMLQFSLVGTTVNKETCPLFPPIFRKLFQAVPCELAGVQGRAKNQWLAREEIELKQHDLEL